MDYKNLIAELPCKEEYIRKINGILSAIKDTYILEQIYRCCVCVTKEEEGE